MTFEQLVRKISPTLKRITYKLNHRFTFFNEEDLYQEALIHLWQDFQEQKLSDKTDSYILQGCYFHLKNYIRKAKEKARLLSIDQIIHDEDEGAKKTFSLKDERSEEFLDDLHNKFLAETIRNNGLTDKEKKTLFLLAEGLTTRQIGHRYKVSHVAVVKLVARARKKCQKYIDKI